MKTSIIIALLFAFSTTERNVYICNSKNSVAYHLKKDCQGLQKCKQSISTVAESDAIGRGLHLCGFED